MHVRYSTYGTSQCCTYGTAHTVHRSAACTVQHIRYIAVAARTVQHIRYIAVLHVRYSTYGTSQCCTYGTAHTVHGSAARTVQHTLHTWRGEIFEGHFSYKMSQTSPIPAEIQLEIIFLVFAFRLCSSLPSFLLSSSSRFLRLPTTQTGQSEMYFDFCALTSNGH